MSGTGYTYDPRFLLHDTGVDEIRLPSGAVLDPEPHPSSLRITRRTAQLVANSGLLAELVQLPARPASHGEVELVHTTAYVQDVRDLAGSGRGTAPGGAPVARGSWEAAMLAAGTTVALTNAVVEGRVTRAFGLVRPSGHHATAGEARGHSIFNNVAVAARYAREVDGLARVAIVDWDVHHGGGTQAVFWDDPDVLVVDLHQDDWYPGSGAVDEVGGPDAEGRTVNVSLPPGTGDRGYLEAVAAVVAPVLRQFEPELVLVSAGQDAAIVDPLGRMMLTRDGYRELAAAVRQVADDVCGGRLVAVQEGGYSAGYTPFCTLGVIEGVAGLRTTVSDPLDAGTELGPRARMELGAPQREALAAVRDVQRRWWRLP